MSTNAKLPLDMLYQWENNHKDRLYMTQPMGDGTVDEFTYEISGACGLLGFLSDTDDGDACPAARAPAASPAGSTLSPHAAAFRPSQHTDAITQARLMWQEAAAALGEDTDAAAGLLVIL